LDRLTKVLLQKECFIFENAFGQFSERAFNQILVKAEIFFKILSQIQRFEGQSFSCQRIIQHQFFIGGSLEQKHIYI